MEKVKFELGSPEHLKAIRQKKTAEIDKLKAGVTAAFDRTADTWNFNHTPEDGKRKASGNPGVDACLLVSDILGEFQLNGTFVTRPTRVERKAGKGAHGITEGSITVEVELKPTAGISQIIEIPVQIRNGYLQRPGVLCVEGQPLILSQSALDATMKHVSFGSDPIRTERSSMFSPPVIEERRAELRLTAEVYIPDHRMFVKAGTQLSLVSDDEESFTFLANDGTMFSLDAESAREFISMI